MKTIKLLAALAIPAMFAACTNEDLIETSQQNNHLKGAEVIASGMSMSFNETNLGARLTNEGWEKKDQIGLGWIVDAVNFPEVDSTGVVPANVLGNALYANDLFVVDGNNEFSTKANIFKGYHFAYFPYEYMESIAQKEVIINKPQTSRDWFERLSQNFYVSELAYLTKDNLDENQQLEHQFTLQNATANILVMTSPEEGSAFAEGGMFEDLEIKGIQLKANSQVFANKALLQPQFLPSDPALLKDSLALGKILKANASTSATGYNSAISTDVEQAGFVVSGNNPLITTTLPKYGGSSTITAEGTSMIIETASGKFTIAYVADAEEDSPAAINNAAIDSLVLAYKAGHTLTMPQSKDATCKLDVVLYADIFEADFTGISDLDEWNDAVEMATALGRTNETFVVDDTIHFENVIPMPENCMIDVQPNVASAAKTPLCIDGALTEWPEGLTSNVNLIVENEASIEDATGIKARNIINNGTIKLPNGTSNEINVLAGKFADIDKDSVLNNGVIELGEYAKVDNVNNSEGTIKVVYGSYVELTTNSASDKGVIAYEYEDGIYAYQLNNLMDDTFQNKAAINTIILDEEDEFNLAMKDADGVGSNDPYTGSTTGTSGASLAYVGNINFIMDGGSLVNTAPTDQSVSKYINNLEVVGGEATLSDVFVSNEITVAADASLSIEGTDNDSDFTANKVTVNGTLNVNRTTWVSEIDNDGSINVMSGKNLYWFSQCTQSGSQSGNIEQKY